MLAAQQHAKEIRQRLLRPWNAVPDLGIDLKRKPLPCARLVVVNNPRKSDPSDEVFGPVIGVFTAPTIGLIVPATPEPLRPPSIARIMSIVAKNYGLTVFDLKSDRRPASISRPRHVAMYLARTLTLRSLPEIGRQMGGRDHTTVLHGVRKMENLIAQDTEFADRIESLKREVVGSSVAYLVQSNVEGAPDDPQPI